MPSPHQGNPSRQTPAAVVRQSWSDAAPAPSPQAMRQQGVNDAERARCTAVTFEDYAFAAQYGLSLFY